MISRMVTKIQTLHFFVSNLTLHQDLDIKLVEEEAAVFYKRSFIN